MEKSKEFSCFEVLGVLYRGLKASPVACASTVQVVDESESGDGGGRGGRV